MSDSYIGPNVVIGAGSRVSECTIRDTIFGERSTIAGCVLTDSMIGDSSGGR